MRPVICALTVDVHGVFLLPDLDAIAHVFTEFDCQIDDADEDG
jgi:hypothetical protein